jgi:hypothetical protein
MESNKHRVSVKDAVQTAVKYINDLYADINLREILLEEVEFSEATDQWIITVGFSLSEIKEDQKSLLLPSFSSRSLSRRYKVVNVDAETGSPISMKIRTL